MVISTSNTISNKNKQNKDVKCKVFECVLPIFSMLKRKIDFEPKTIYKEIKQKSNNRISRSKLIIGVIKVYQFFEQSETTYIESHIYLLKAIFNVIWKIDEVSFRRILSDLKKIKLQYIIISSFLHFITFKRDDKCGIQYYKKSILFFIWPYLHFLYLRYHFSLKK